MSEQENDDTTQGDSGLSLKVFADLNLVLGDVRNQLKAARREQARLAAQPNVVSLEQMAQPGASATFVQDMGTPPDGRTWIVRLLIAMANPIAPNTSVVTWYIGQNISSGNAGQLIPTSARWQFPSVPGFQTFTSNVLQILPKQHLLAGLTNIPATSNIALVAMVNDLPLHGPLSVVSGD